MRAGNQTRAEPPVDSLSSVLPFYGTVSGMMMMMMMPPNVTITSAPPLKLVVFVRPSASYSFYSYPELGKAIPH